MLVNPGQMCLNFWDEYKQNLNIVRGKHVLTKVDVQQLGRKAQSNIPVKMRENVQQNKWKNNWTETGVNECYQMFFITSVINFSVTALKFCTFESRFDED